MWRRVVFDRSPNMHLYQESKGMANAVTVTVLGEVPLVKPFQPFSMYREAPCSAGIKQVVIDPVSIELSSRDNFWHC